ncbi:uncharacterized protein EI90DRAFT_3093584 [Cantharellus anzutake]|uniref:uncharacterized protein n=1 Tax=Cantharellus anzutake TaxID=1750568 RepID=UPI0019060C08|nr:uncharacterized protein EI90DRAFT_3093584 [Cantharellus anzutake]KAF8312432.1 hypothetical protein EI90DRAFT_3093584 [Cantharellus anzutake]
MTNPSNSVVKNHDLALECMPQEFETFVDLVHDALKKFRPPSRSIFEPLAQNLQGFDAWRKGTKSDIHLCPSASSPTFKTTVAREIFPLIASSILIVRAHWADQHSSGAATELMALDIPLPYHGGRGTVQYWLSNIPERLVALRERFPRCLEITSQLFPPGNKVPTARELIDYASRLETTSQQLRMITHIYYCAAALREMRELGPEKFFEGCLHTSSERHSYASPLIMTILISPLVLLFDATLTNPSAIPSITAMLSYAVLRGGLRESNGPRKVLENALLNLIFSVSQTGQISQHDLERFHAAWTKILPCIPETIISPPDMDPREIGNENTPLHSTGQASDMHPSMPQSFAAAEISFIAQTPTPHSTIAKPSTIPSVHPQLAPDAPDDWDETFTPGQKESRQNPPFTWLSSSASQKRRRYDRQPGDRERARKPVNLGTGHIQEVSVTEETITSISSLDKCKMWPHVTTIDKTLDVPELNPDTWSKLLHPVDLHVISLVNEGRSSQRETFFFPYCRCSPSLQKLKHYLESPQHDSKDWKPVLMTIQGALAMDAREFQRKVNDGTPIVLVDHPMQIPFRALGFDELQQSEVQCIDSDHFLSTRHPQILEMATSNALHEICDWRRSRPLILSQTSTGHHQSIESLLNTHEVALADFPLRGRNWRHPIVAAAGSIHPPHHAPNGMGTSLCCASGYAIFFIPILKGDQFMMSCFNGTDAPPNPNFSYLYEAPYRFTSFVLSPGQTVIFPPGQVYAYASLSRKVNNKLIPGCIMRSSNFLAAGCMKRSFLMSRLRRNCANQSKSEETWNSGVTVSLMAMVWNAVCAVSTGQEQPIHSPDLVNLASLAAMATEFIGDREPRFSGVVRSLVHYCADQEPDSVPNSHVNNYQLCV